MTAHPEVSLQVTPDYIVPVDEGIAELITEIWRAGLTTALSCQDNCYEEAPSGCIWIEFTSAPEAEAFLGFVSGPYSDDPDSLYSRIREGGCPSDCNGVDCHQKHGAWRYSVGVEDLNVNGWEEGDYWVEKSVGPPQFLFLLSVRFPHRDYGDVLRRMRSAPDDIVGKVKPAEDETREGSK